MQQSIWHETLRDYGVPPTAQGARQFAARTRPESKITSPGHYVAAVRRLLARGVVADSEDLARVDGRLLAVGFNRYSPSAWVREGELLRFLEYWERVSERPRIVGSSKNKYDPEIADVLRRIGVPAGIAYRLPSTLGYRLAERHEREGRVVGRISMRHRLDLARAARAASRTSYTALKHALVFDERLFSTKTLAALGRLTPELQRVALEALRPTLERYAVMPWDSDSLRRRIRVRDIPWDIVSTAQKAFAASPEKRIAAARGKRQGELIVVQWDTYRDIPLADVGMRFLRDKYPQFPGLKYEQYLRLINGETPVELSDGHLTKREAHRWLSTYPQLSVAEFLCVGLRRNVPPIRSVAVARWLQRLSAAQWDQLERSRTFAGPGGRQVNGRFIDRLDEVQQSDLDESRVTPVMTVFERVATRFGTEWEARFSKDWRALPDLPRGWKLYRCMRHVNTPADLIREGQDMQHCVGSYVPVVESGESIILAISVLGHRSTVELSRRGRVLQHHGPGNSAPHVFCARVLERFVRRAGAA